MRFRAGQLANGVAVLAGDFGFREAVASGHVPTILSAARNNAQRIGADMVLVLDTRGRVLASSAAPARSAADGSLASLLADADGERDQPHFRVFGAQSYQFFLAPVRTPETIAWVAMGFVADDALAQQDPRPGGLPGGDRHPRPRRPLRVASTLAAGARAARRARSAGADRAAHACRAARRRRVPELRAPPGCRAATRST